MRKAFTLIELLVVIAIIGILAAVVMLAINPAEMMRKGRDSTRLSDLENTRKSIDMAVADGATVSAGGPFNSVTHGRACTSAAGWVRGIDVCTFLSTLPIDPTNNATYQYQFQADASSNYEIRCQLESSANDTKEANDGGDDATYYEVGTDPGLDLM